MDCPLHLHLPGLPLLGRPGTAARARARARAQIGLTRGHGWRGQLTPPSRSWRRHRALWEPPRQLLQRTPGGGARRRGPWACPDADAGVCCAGGCSGDEGKV
eukprot:scaffold3659_cov338-Prasinococcus_capsulatus_cf.AAC.2